MPKRHLRSPDRQRDVAAKARKAARAAALTYMCDRRSGIHRVRRGAGFIYQTARGKAIHDKATLSRIRGLVIPPAWTDVWVCPAANGHLQVTGRDARGRKQYIYHPRWRTVRDENKFDRLTAFGAELPRLRRRVRRDLHLPGISREKVLATIIRLLERSLIRVGNEEYARSNHSFGLTTLKNQHVRVNGPTMLFRFRGKSGQAHAVSVTDKRVARVVKRCQELTGGYLFEYLDENGRPHSVTSTQVNEYLRQITGSDFTAKDFRTWAGTLLAAKLLCQSTASRPTRIATVIKEVSQQLGNTPTVCRKCYVHPQVIASAAGGQLRRALRQTGKASHKHGLRGDEVALMRLLKSSS
jgi:DNA topoisomerase I